MEVIYPDGATPLDPDEAEALIPDYITTRAELNQLEQANILDATDWAARKHADILNATFLFSLHRRMFGRVWKWAGKPRKSNKTIGIDKAEIYTGLNNLFANTKYWIDHQTFEWDEIGLRFHHELVRIHPFVNGNGRHARLMTEILLESNGQPRFTWGATTSQDLLQVQGELRNAYISALREADKGNFVPLREFVRK